MPLCLATIVIACTSAVNWILSILSVGEQAFLLLIILRKSDPVRMFSRADQRHSGTPLQI